MVSTDDCTVVRPELACEIECTHHPWHSHVRKAPGNYLRQSGDLLVLTKVNGDEFMVLQALLATKAEHAHSPERKAGSRKQNATHH